MKLKYSGLTEQAGNRLSMPAGSDAAIMEGMKKAKRT